MYKTSGVLVFLSVVLSACVPSSSPNLLAGKDLAGKDTKDTVAQLKLANPQPQQVQIVVMGDQGTGTQTQKQVAQAMQTLCQQQGCDFGIGLGDNFYPAGPKDANSELFKERFADVYGPLNIPFLMIAGNHDESWLFGGDGADAAGADAQVAYAKLNPQWVMPERHYRASVGGLLEIFALDVTPLAAYLPTLRPNERHGGSQDIAQRQWLSDSLNQSQAQWKLVLGHYPLFSNGKHGNAGAYDNLPLAFQRGDAVKTLYQLACNKADMLLSGHEHALEVFAPQSECPNTWTVVSGAAGQTETSRLGWRMAAFEEYNNAGFSWLRVTCDALEIRMYTAKNGEPKLAYSQILPAKSQFHINGSK